MSKISLPKWLIPAAIGGIILISTPAFGKSNRWQWPLSYFKITSGFGPRPAVFGSGIEKHSGIDFAAEYGDPIFGVANGKVVQMGADNSSGIFVIIRSDSGVSYSFSHMSAYATGLSVGDIITPNDLVGYVGSSGTSSGPHLHFAAINQSGQFIDPTYFFPQPAIKGLYFNSANA